MWETGPQTFSNIQAVEVKIRNLQNKYPRGWRSPIFIEHDSFSVTHIQFLNPRILHGTYVLVTIKKQKKNKFTRGSGKVSVAA